MVGGLQRVGEWTFAGTRSNGEVAPIPAVCRWPIGYIGCAAPPSTVILTWIVLGLIAGFIAAKIVNKKGAGFFLDIVLGIVGAVVGGFLFTALGESAVTGFNLYSLVVAVVGAIVVLVIYHAIVGRRVY
jgi:uncharacterized membrane protein YeaQ/YmgE (transglycosylase-associated protein family)